MRQHSHIFLEFMAFCSGWREYLSCVKLLRVSVSDGTLVLCNFCEVKIVSLIDKKLIYSLFFFCVILDACFNMSCHVSVVYIFSRCRMYLQHHYNVSSKTDQRPKDVSHSGKLI